MKLKALIAATTLALGFASGTKAQGFADCAATGNASFDGTVVDAAIATPELSTLVNAVVAAGLADALATTDNITVFAPTNDAFAALPEPVLNAVLASPDLLSAVLTYHVVPTTNADPRKYFTVSRRPTLQGQNVYFAWSDGAARVNNAAVTCQGVEVDNGVVYLIDSVLLPNL
ncbi:fasciclin domain-containing protein [Mangrovimicrobium sediminis]|nr:fasciclin domain-containing protein [Haliea sp. SAOS-164]